MKALITGAGGFVGGFLAEHLLENEIEVWGTVFNEDSSEDLSDKVIFRRMDITQQSQVQAVLNECKPDYIFHLAAQSSAAVSWKKPQDTINVNINGTVNLLESIRELDINPRILLIGSSEEYGFIKPEDLPVNEKQELRPGNPYSVSKIAHTLLGEVYARAYNMDVVMVRAFNHIGPKQSPIFVASDFAKRIAEIEKGKIEHVLLVGNLEAERDFTDVRDIVKAYYSLIQKGHKGEIYNVGSGISYKIQYILDVLLSLSKTKIEVKQDPDRMRPSDVPVVRCDNSKLKNTINWEPSYSIEDTLKDVLNYWRGNI